jgi:hypothetical protein
VVKHFQPALQKGSKVVNLTAKVASITNNDMGGWYSYRASKTALNMSKDPPSRFNNFFLLLIPVIFAMLSIYLIGILQMKFIKFMLINSFFSHQKPRDRVGP